MDLFEFARVSRSVSVVFFVVFVLQRLSWLRFVLELVFNRRERSERRISRDFIAGSLVRFGIWL